MLIRSCLFAAFVGGGAIAQAAAQTASPEPAPLKYESTFTGYQPYRDGKRGDWRELNETVGVLGGHAGHLRGSTPEASAAKPVMAPAAPPDSPAGAFIKPQLAPADPHAGHRK